MFVSPAVLASLVAAAIATLGLVSVVLRGDWALRHSTYFTAFAAGVLVTTGLTLFPSAAAQTPYAPIGALLGYLLLYGTNLFFRAAANAAVAPIVAIGLHSFIDGLEYGVLFSHDGRLGLMAAIGLIAHEFAEGVILYAALRAAGLRVGGALIGAFLGAAVTTPAGAVASAPILSTLRPEELGLLLAGTSGALLYVGATHLPMHIAWEGRRGLVAVYALGVALALGLSLTAPDRHDHAPGIMINGKGT